MRTRMMTTKIWFSIMKAADLAVKMQERQVYATRDHSWRRLAARPLRIDSAMVVDYSLYVE